MMLVKDQYVLNNIRYLHKKFADYEFQSAFFEKDHVLDKSTLIVYADQDFKKRERLVSISYLLNQNKDKTNVLLLQLYTELPVEIGATQIPLAETIVSFINTRMPLGHFGILNNKVHYRYVMIDSKVSHDHALQTIDTFTAYVSILKHFHEAIESTIQGKMTLDTLKSTF